jgi:hypothetical protein
MLKELKNKTWKSQKSQKTAGRYARRVPRTKGKGKSQGAAEKEKKGSDVGRYVRFFKVCEIFRKICVRCLWLTMLKNAQKRDKR